MPRVGIKERIALASETAGRLVYGFVLAVVREWFAVLSRSLNSASAFLLSLLSGRSYRRTAARHAQAKQQAWHRWWRSSRGTFNALLEQEGLAGEPPAQRADAGHSPLPSPQLPRRSFDAASSASSSPLGGGGGSSGRWRFWRRASSLPPEDVPPTPTSASELRRGSVLFELPSGFGVSQMVSSRGLLEDLRVGTEVAVGHAFAATRRGLHRALLLDSGASAGDRGSPADMLERSLRHATPPPEPAAERRGGGAGPAGAAATGAAGRPPLPPKQRGRGTRRPPLKSLLRSGRHWEDDLSVWTASDVILREGYPLEQHSVTTADGYVLQMQRIPRHGARDVAFFQHGVLDTSLGWVSNGVVGSAAFAAFDAGFDVWLANSRSNAPRLHVDAERQGARFWRYTVNELAMCDIAAQITHIHNTKMAELAAPGRHTAAAQEPVGGSAGEGLRRAATDSVLDALRWVDVHTSGGSSSAKGVERGTAGAADQAQQELQPPPQQQLGGTGASEQPSSRGLSGGPSWLHRLTGQQGAQPPGDLAQAPVGRGATPLRRTQSAAEPLQAGRGDAGGGQMAVPIRMRLPAAAGGSSSGSSGAGSGGAAGSAAGSAAQDVLPYRLQAVGHSLGAASLLLYATVCRMRGEPHRLRRLVLMSPAGFHPSVPLGLRWGKYFFPALVWLVDRTPGLRGLGAGLRLPSPLLRYITFKFTMDLRHMPALQDLVRAGMRWATSGDSSQWDAAMQMPHYSTYSMPALSMHCGAHFAQWSLDPSFCLFDYGTKAANRQHYGSDRPPSVAAHFHLLDIPVDLLAGAADGIISPACVAMHAQRLRAAGVPCSFRILPAGHMDLTFAVRDDIRLFILSKLRSPL